MILLTTEEIINYQKMLIELYGGDSGLRDKGLLESAIYSVYAGFGEYEKYPTLEEKVARLTYSLITNHAFIDGNKRIGIFVMLTTLEVNNIFLQYEQSELISLGLSIANKDIEYDGILEWIKTHFSIEQK